MTHVFEKEARTLDRRRNPHIWSQALKLLEDRSLVELLDLVVIWSALLDSHETLEVQSFAGLLHCCDPRTNSTAVSSLGFGAPLLAHDAASLGHLQVRGFQSSLGLVDLEQRRDAWQALLRLAS